LLAASALAMLVLVAPGTGAAATPPVSPQAKAEAITAPSVVYVTTKWKGWVRLTSGHLLSRYPFYVSTTCSGFAASPDGYVVTAGHCVDDRSSDGGKGLLIKQALIELVQAHRLTLAEARALLQHAYMNWRVEGTQSGSPPDRVVDVYRTVAASGVPVSQPLQASVLSFSSLRTGDVALLKVVPPTPMAALAVAAQSPDNGTEVVSAGYPGSVAQVTDPKLMPSFKEGSTSSAQTLNGVPFIEVSAAASPGMSGGPTVNLDGQVVGTVSFGPSGESQAFNFITDTSTVRALLARNGVPITLSAADQAYRAGLTDYYAGHYHDAVAEFDKVLAVEPGQATAQQYRAKAIANYPNEASGTSPWLYVGIGAGALVLIAVVIVVALMISRRHRAPPAQAPPSAAPSPESSPAADQVACPNCGTPHPRDAHFCASCGRQFAPPGGR
jgi:serine protease Do